MDTYKIKITQDLKKTFEECFKNENISISYEEIMLFFFNHGWSRFMMFKECILLFQSNSYTESELDNLIEFYVDIIGNCLVGEMIKLPNEPQDLNEFNYYIRNELWKK